MGRPIKIAKAQAVLTITATTATTNLVTVSQNLNTLGVIAGMPFIPATTVGGLTGGTTYWVLEVVDANNFTASATHPSANTTRTPSTLTTTTSQTVAATVGLVDYSFNNPVNATYGVVGGNTALYGSQVLVGVCMGMAGTGTISYADDSPNLEGVGTDFANTLSDGTIVYTTDGTIVGTITDIANANATFATFEANAPANVSGASFVFGTPEAGYIVRQKGKTKYLVTGTTTGLTQACYTANVANTALAPNTFNIIATYADANTAFVQSLNDYQSQVFYDTNDANANPDVIATFGTAYAANTYGGQPNPIVTINKQ